MFPVECAVGNRKEIEADRKLHAMYIRFRTRNKFIHDII
jgi:hypothetical protein